jgi:hypothetical protein
MTWGLAVYRTTDVDEAVSFRVVESQRDDVRALP